MQAYQINELEKLTGVKAHTIRIWEKRYSLITPSRTDTNRRYYSDDQVRKLLNVTTLLSKGHKISKIAQYSENQLAEYVQLEDKNQEEEDKRTTYINDLLKYMLVFDQAGFENTFQAAMQEYGVYDTMLDVVYPFLHKTGVMWSINKVIPVHEHFASCIIRQKLIAAIDNIPRTGVSKKKFLLFLPPSEWHEIGLLFANFIIRSHGHETLYLGQNVPIENVMKICKSIEATHMLTFYTVARPHEDLYKQVGELAGRCPDVTLYAVRKQEHSDEKAPWKNVTYLYNVDELVEVV